MRTNYINRLSVRFQALFALLVLATSVSVRAQSPAAAGNQEGAKIYAITSGLEVDMVRCIDAVCNIWSNELELAQPVVLKFELCDDMEDDETRADVDVIYATASGVQYMTPFALYCQTKGRPEGEHLYDAVIRINENWGWDFAMTDTAKEGEEIWSFPLTMMRAVGSALGFGASVRERSGKVLYSFPSGHSVFDTLVADGSNKTLKSISNKGYTENAQLVSFVKAPQVYAKTATASYKLYTPSTFDAVKSLTFLDLDGSLMHYDPSGVAETFRVDNATRDLLSAIGWEFRAKSDVEISGVNVSRNHMVSVYDASVFEARSSGGKTLTDARWSLQVGGREYVTSAGSTKITLPALETISAGLLSASERDLIGYLTFTGNANGAAVKDTYRILFDRKPKILSLTIDGMTKSSKMDNCYDLAYTVKVKGSEYASVSLVYDYGSRPQGFYGDGEVHSVFETIGKSRNCTLEAEARNNYGKSKLVIPIPEFTGAPLKKEGLEVKTVDVYSDSGDAILRDAPAAAVERLRPGIYIVVKTYEDGTSSSEKVIKE